MQHLAARRRLHRARPWEGPYWRLLACNSLGWQLPVLGPLLQQGLLLLEGHLLLQEALLVLSSEVPLLARVTHSCSSGLASKPQAGSAPACAACLLQACAATAGQPRACMKQQAAHLQRQSDIEKQDAMQHWLRRLARSGMHSQARACVNTLTK